MIESITIGDYCFENVRSFKINGLDELIALTIRSNSFSRVKMDDDWDSDLLNNISRSFGILNCDKLESIEIGRYSFSDYSDGFELRNLPKLSTIKIGEIGSDSSNFCYSPFEIKSIIDVMINE